VRTVLHTIWICRDFWAYLRFSLLCFLRICGQGKDKPYYIILEGIFLVLDFKVLWSTVKYVSLYQVTDTYFRSEGVYYKLIHLGYINTKFIPIQLECYIIHYSSWDLSLDNASALDKVNIYLTSFTRKIRNLLDLDTESAIVISLNIASKGLKVVQ
jgi:hypothetical protein